MKEEHEKKHRLALQRFEQVETKEKDQRTLAVEDLKFAQSEDGQWDDDAIEKRKGRPRYTINRIAGAIDQLIGDQRQNRTSIKIRPVSGGASEDVAEVMSGLIRNIEGYSKAANAYDNAFDEVVNGGYGGWRVLSQFNDDDAFEQDLVIKPILGATTSLWFDPAAKEYDKRDANWAFLTVEMTKEEHEARFPDKPLVNFDTYENRSACQSWMSEDTVRVAEYWVKTPMMREIAKLSDGRVIDLKEDGEALDELALQGVTVVKTRKVKSHKVEMYLMNGSGFLDGPKPWAGKYIPLVPVYGRQSFINGKEYTRGLVRFAKDANRIYNYATSSAIETTALAPKDPIWYTPTQVAGHEDKYRNFNTQNSPFMPYNPDPTTGGAPPQRGGAPAVQSAILQQINQASMDLYHVTGMQPPSFAANPELKSGKAIQAQERLGDRGQFIFTDNLTKSIEYTAEILVDLIPRTYDTERQVRIMMQDGETELVTINQEIIDDQTGQPIIVNDLTSGKYDIIAETGPAFASQRQESAQQILELIATSPMFESLAMDLVAKDLPILESKELTKRVRRAMIKQGVVEPSDEEIKELGLDQPQAPDPQQQAITENIQIQTEKLISEIENKDADTVEKKLKAQQSTIETYKTLIEALEKKIEMGISLSPQDRSAVVKQLDIMREGQQEIDEGPNSEEAQDLARMMHAQQGQAALGEQIGATRRPTVEQPSTQAGQNIESQ